MQKIEHILVATDLSEMSQEAVKTAASLASKFGASLTLLHVFDPAPFVPPAAIPNPARFEEKIAKELEEAVDQGLANLVAKLLPDFPEDRLSVASIRHPSAAQGIVDFAAEQEADLLIVGTHGRTGLRHLLIGSVAEKVVRHSPCAVLTVRPAD